VKTQAVTRKQPASLSARDCSPRPSWCLSSFSKPHVVMVDGEVEPRLIVLQEIVSASLFGRSQHFS
jgi:hypothetical protein